MLIAKFSDLSLTKLRKIQCYIGGGGWGLGLRRRNSEITSNLTICGDIAAMLRS